MKKFKQPKERSFIGKLIDIHHEQAIRRKALRLLTKQEWGIDVIAMMMVKAGQHLGNGIAFTIENRAGQKLTLTYNEALKYDNALRDADNNIFNKLDDDLAVEQFIREHSRR